MKVTAFWDNAPCITLMMEAVSTSETSLSFSEPTHDATLRKAIFILASMRT
jgi:hypothetical protein